MDVVIERRLARRASTQSGLITRAQLTKLGVSRGQISRLVDAGRLVHSCTGVFLLGGAPSSPAVDLAAACLSTGGVVSHRSAAHLHGIIEQAPSRPELTVGSSHSMRAAPLLHRSSDLLPNDIIRKEGMRTTNATRTLVDLGAVVPGTVLESAIERALHERLTTFDRLVRRFFQLARSGRPGIGPLRTLLVDRDPRLAPAESDLETLLLRILRIGGLPEPVRQFNVCVGAATYRLDIAYPDLKIFIEGDGFGTHSSRDSFETDRERQNLLVIEGWLPLRFTWRVLCHNPQRVVAQVLRARDRRLRGLS